MRRGEVYWADLGPPLGRRPVLLLTRDAAIPVLLRLMVAPITSTTRGIASEVPLDQGEGLREESVATCDNVLTIPKAILDPEPVGALGPAKVQALDQAMRYALDIRY